MRFCSLFDIVCALFIVDCCFFCTGSFKTILVFSKTAKPAFKALIHDLGLCILRGSVYLSAKLSIHSITDKDLKIFGHIIVIFAVPKRTGRPGRNDVSRNLPNNPGAINRVSTVSDFSHFFKYQILF